MKYLVTLHDKINLNQVLNYADGIVIGNNDFSARLTKSFTIDEINEIAEKTIKLNKEIFLNFNQMMDDSHINNLIKFIKNIDIENISGVIVADIGAFVILKELGFTNIIYNPETLLTNSFDFNFMKRFGLYGAFVAKEITLEDILVIGQKREYSLFFVGHGYLNMFYSRRHLLDHYQSYLGEEHNLDNRYDLKIIEEKRAKEPYPIYQDESGTHVFRSKIFSSINVINQLKEVVDYFYIDTIFESDEYAL